VCVPLRAQHLALGHHVEQLGNRTQSYMHYNIRHPRQYIYNTKLQLMALVKGSNFCMIALPLTDLGPTNALFAALLCWFDLVGVRVVCLQGWSPTSAIAMHECGAIVDKQTVRRSFDLFDT
jgi:hypothetical protein